MFSPSKLLLVAWCVVSTKSERSVKVFLLPEEERRNLQPVLDAFESLGVKELDAPDATSWHAAARSGEFDVVWSYEFTDLHALGPLEPRHKVNHLPGSHAIVSKRNIYNTQLKLQEHFGKEHYDFIPQHYRLPEEREQFIDAFRSLSNSSDIDTNPDDPNYRRRWLIKNQQHRGIHFFSGLEQLSQHMTTNDMVAQCIEPLLVSGHKFDIGLHVLIASIDPLRVYIYQNAVLRFCKLQYPTSLNDSSPLESYVVEDYLPPWEIPDLKPYYHEIPSFDVEGTNHFAVLRQYLAHVNIDPDEFQKEIYGAVVKLIAGNRDHFKRMQRRFHQDYQQPGANNFFEMCRFDFMVDDKGKPWLMEVNQSPNLTPKIFASGNDAKAKENIVTDLLRMIGVQSPAEAIRRNKIFQVNNNYCDPKCQDMERMYDMTCWHCPGWLTSAEANVLYQSAVEYLRRGRYNLIFPTADDVHAPFLDGGRTSYDIAFSRYIQALAREKLDLNASVICSKSDHCSTHGVCVNGQCICDSGFEGVVCAEVVLRKNQEENLLPLDIGISHVKNPNNSTDKLKNFHSANLRVVGAATMPHGTSTFSIIHLTIGMTNVFGTIYFITKFVKCKRRTAKEQ